MKARILWNTRTKTRCDLRLMEYAPGSRQPPHAHARDSITIVLRGDLIEGSDRGEERACALSVVAKPSGVEHENLFGPRGARTLQIELPSERRHWTPQMPRASASWEHAGPACRALLRLLVRLDFDAREASCRAEALVHQTLAGLSFASSSQADPPRWLMELRVALEREATTSMAGLAHRVGMHPVYVARRFRAQFGVSPTAFRARLRAQRAARALLEADDSLGSVALDAGYFDQPHMNRQIRTITGLTPRTLRAVSGLSNGPETRGAA